MFGMLRKLVYLVLVLGAVSGCPREPTPFQSREPKTPGDNGFKIMISGDPDKYVPGEIYTLFLMGSRSFENIQHFNRFMLNAESADNPGDYSPQKVGSFQLYRDSLSSFNEQCVNTISELNDLQKTEVYVMWTAPPAGSGCITFRGMVLQASRNWFAEDGQLTRTICEELDEDASGTSQDCCACDEAKYTVTFEGLWSKETHPRDFPTSAWLTHFSDLIGASHVTNWTFWGENHVSTDGFRSLAEWGSPRLLESELRSQSSKLKSIVKTPGLWYPNVNTNTTGTFKVDRTRNLVSAASMFGPSPDWVVGVSNLNLCEKTCTWVPSITVDLYPWDAGTDSGITYMSPNSETSPREKMHRITTLYPEDPRSPFYDPKGREMPPLARLHFTRDKLISRGGCEDNFLQAQVGLEGDVEEDAGRPECAVGEQGPWTPCSVTCGKGLRMSQREYITKELAKSSNCQRQLVFKEMCVADVPECPEDSSNELIEDTQLICRTTSWSTWSPCSATCGPGITMRTRRFLDRMGRKKCPHVNLVEKDECSLPPCDAEADPIDAMCPVSDWSEWSPCSATCGPGVRLRKRYILVEPGLQQKCGMTKETVQQTPCNDREECGLTMQEAKVVCMEPEETGPCRGSFRRWYYNAMKRMCVPFVYGGCRGNKNNFLSQEECDTNCGFLGGGPAFAEDAVDCMMTPWSEWSACSVTCGVGYSQRRRYIKAEASNGGVPCPRKLARRKICSRPPC